VVKLTEGLTNLDDLTALCLVARGVALRSSGRMDESLAALDLAINAPGRHPGMINAALQERANVLRSMGDELGAQADCDRMSALEGGTAPEALLPREAQAMAEPPPPPKIGSTDPEAMAAARVRVRRHIAMNGAPGTFGGRHHHTYQPEVEAMLAAGQFEAAANLLLGLLDAVEDEAEVQAVPIDPTFYLTLADLFSHQGERAEYIAIMERFQAASQRFGTLSDDAELAEAVAAIEELARRDGSRAAPADALVDH
jgi:hypothetical protein